MFLISSRLLFLGSLTLRSPEHVRPSLKRRISVVVFASVFLSSSLIFLGDLACVGKHFSIVLNKHRYTVSVPVFDVVNKLSVFCTYSVFFIFPLKLALLDFLLESPNSLTQNVELL